MRIADAVYDEYAVIHTIKTKEGVSQVLNKLYSKWPGSSSNNLCQNENRKLKNCFEPW